MALARSMGWVALIQCRASSPTLLRGDHRRGLPGPRPTCRCALARRVGPEVLVQRVLNQRVGEAVPARVSPSSRTRDTARRLRGCREPLLGRLRRRARRSRSKSRPITAAIDNTRPASSPRRPTRAPITSRTLSGRVICSSGSATHRPLLLVDRARLRQMAQHLADEERVAVGLAIHGGGEAHRRVVEGVTGSRLHERHHTGVIEPGQFDTRDSGCRAASPRSPRSGWEGDSSLSR